MKKLALQKIVTLIATLALGSGCIANDALARGDVGFSGGGTGDGSFLKASARMQNWGAAAGPSSMATIGIVPRDSSAGKRKTFPPMPLGAYVRTWMVPAINGCGRSDASFIL